jgi:integrase/recombinase XerD
MTQDAKSKLEQYLAVRFEESPFLFTSLSPNSKGKGLSRNAIEDIVRHYAACVGINKKVTPHTLRHSFATSLLKK